MSGTIIPFGPPRWLGRVAVADKLPDKDSNLEPSG
jgi:hypothetical protein